MDTCRNAQKVASAITIMIILISLFITLFLINEFRPIFRFFLLFHFVAKTFATIQMLRHNNFANIEEKFSNLRRKISTLREIFGNYTLK